MTKNRSATIELVKKRVSESSFQRELESLLMDILIIDTSPALGIAKLRTAEEAVFNKLSGYLNGLDGLRGSLVKHPISQHINKHNYYTKVFPPSGNQEIPAESAYAGRYNLLYLVDSGSEKKGRNVGLNAHIDVVNPYFPPLKEDEYIHGRGSTDDKGGIIVIIGALTILNSLINSGDLSLTSNIAGMFVIEEEMGGNGSLSVAMDHDLQTKYYDSLLVLECAENKIYPGNRGAVFVKIDGTINVKSETILQSKLVESFAFGIRGIVDEGLKIKKESRHPMFPQNPVYTCTGMLGQFGKHPSGICDYIEFRIQGLQDADYEAAVGVLETGLQKYIQIFNDKRDMIDPLTGLPKISVHYKITKEKSHSYCFGIYGSGGHMGSLPDNDAAITKWAYIVKELAEWKHTQGKGFTFSLSKDVGLDSLIFEGAQSFLPCHKMEEIQSRITNSFNRGVRDYWDDRDMGDPSYINWTISYNKLRNEAFASDPASNSMKNAVAAAEGAGIFLPEQVQVQELRGWDASCDARIFAKEYPELPVITTGPGDLNGAHSDKEVLFLPDLYKSISAAVFYILEESDSGE